MNNAQVRLRQPGLFAYLATASLAAVTLTGCTTRPATQTTPIVDTPLPSPTASPTPAAAIAVDEAAHTACQHFFGTHADQGPVDVDNPLLPVIAASAVKSANFAVRFDGQRLDEAMKSGGHETVQLAAADLYRDCKNLDALK